MHWLQQHLRIVHLLILVKLTMASRHLNIIPLELHPILVLHRNATGYIYDMTGIVIPLFYWLSEKLHFTYTFRQVDFYIVENSTTTRGAMSYVDSGEADMILGCLRMTQSRYQHFDYPHPWCTTSFNLMIPIPGVSSNISAVWRSFEISVWVAIFISMIIMTLSLYFTTRYMQSNDSQNEPQNLAKTYRPTLYVVGLIVSQGGYCPSKKMKIRILAGTWCLATVVLANVYSSTLISYVSAPTRQPIIDSINDIPKVAGLQVAVDKGLGADVVVSGTTTGILKEVAQQMNRNPRNRCVKTDDCVQMVRDGSHVYMHGDIYVMNAINKDLKDTGRCSFMTAKEAVGNVGPSGLALSKRSPHTESFSRAIMTAQQFGLTNIWFARYAPRPLKCLNALREKPSNPRLTLTNLIGAFVVLAFGSIVAIITLVVEVIYHKLHRTFKKKL